MRSERLKEGPPLAENAVDAGLGEEPDKCDVSHTLPCLHLMFSLKQKREISDAIQKILRATNHPELPQGEIQFSLHVDGEQSWSWADIKNNGAVSNPGINPWNEAQDPRTSITLD